MTRAYSFIRMRASRANDSLVVAAVLDEQDTYSFGTLLCWYNHKDAGQKWGSLQDASGLPFWTVGINRSYRVSTRSDRLCLISAEGDVAYIEEPIAIERIAGAGIESEDSKFYGRMKAIVGINESLFACGDGGQIYRREINGTWTNIAPHLLQGPEVPLGEYDELEAIDGPNSRDVYIVGGRGRMLHFDGSEVTALPVVTNAGLIKICVENEKRIWVCGTDGTLLVGNRQEGFRQAPGVKGSHHFNSLTLYDGQIYLASFRGDQGGIYRYEDGTLIRVETGLAPDIRGVSHIDAGAGVLWATSIKDIVRFDGKTWERIDFPFNDAIR